jgi:hypothetical protein
MFSCHDAGWTGPPGNKLNLHGSRASIGYLGVFSWRIPLFFSGEEFNNEPRGLPALAAGLYSGGGPCCAPDQRATGGWSYGTQIDLASIATNSTRSSMFEDVSRMFSIRNAHPRSLHRDRCTARLASLVNFSVTDAAGQPLQNTSELVWVPYARWVASSPSAGQHVQQQELILVAANHFRSGDPGRGEGMGDDGTIVINPGLSSEFVQSIFGPAVTRLNVTDLWSTATTPTTAGGASNACEAR